YFRALAATSAFGPRLTLAQYYAAMKRFDAARDVLQELAGSSEYSASATVRLAALDASVGKPAEAAARVEEVLAKDPEDVRALLLKANLLWLDHKNDEAIETATLAVAAAPRSTITHLTLGRVEEAADRTDEAIKEYEQAFRLDARSYAAAVALARLH